MSGTIGKLSNSIDPLLLNGLKRQGEASFSESSALSNTGKKEMAAAQDFEAMLVKQMFQSMWSTIPKDGLMGSGKEEDMFRDMLNDTLSQDLAKQQSFGIKDIVAKELKARQK